jgi:hypothetical protein
LLIVFLLIMGCRPPPDAPENLDELMSYLFEHALDERDDALVAGTENLTVWMSANLEETFDGYRVTNLSSESVASLDGSERDLDGLVGAAVGYDIAYPFELVSDVMISTDPMDLYPDVYADNSREYLTDFDCFVAQECELLSFTAETTFNYPLNIVASTKARTDYRWLQLSNGQMASVQRVWMTEPAEVNVDWLTLEQNYFIAVAFPEGDITRRVESTWAIVKLGDGGVSEDVALNLTISNMKKTGERISTYIANME